MVIFERITVINTIVNNLKTAGVLLDNEVTNFKDNLQPKSNHYLLTTLVESHNQREHAISNGYARIAPCQN